MTCCILVSSCHLSLLCCHFAVTIAVTHTALSLLSCGPHRGSDQYTMSSSAATHQGVSVLSKETKMDAIGDSTPAVAAAVGDDPGLLPKSTATSFNIFQPGLEESSQSSS